MRSLKCRCASSGAASSSPPLRVIAYCTSLSLHQTGSGELAPHRLGWTGLDSPDTSNAKRAGRNTTTASRVGRTSRVAASTEEDQDAGDQLAMVVVGRDGAKKNWRRGGTRRHHGQAPSPDVDVGRPDRRRFTRFRLTADRCTCSGTFMPQGRPHRFWLVSWRLARWFGRRWRSEHRQGDRRQSRNQDDRRTYLRGRARAPALLISTLVTCWFEGSWAGWGRGRRWRRWLGRLRLCCRSRPGGAGW